MSDNEEKAIQFFARISQALQMSGGSPCSANIIFFEAIVLINSCFTIFPGKYRVFFLPCNVLGKE